jgi:hypothetical protein
MNEDILTGFGLDDNSRLEFNKETGEFTLRGKAEKGSYSYGILEQAYRMQNLSDKLDNGTLEEDDIDDVLSALKGILAGARAIPQNKSSFSIPSFLDEDERFIMEDVKTLDEHEWVRQSKDEGMKVHVYAECQNYNDFDTKKIVNLFLKEDSGKTLESLSTKDKFFSYAVINRNMFHFMTESQVFQSAAEALGQEIDIYEFEDEDSRASYRILLKDNTGKVSVIYFK